MNILRSLLSGKKKRKEETNNNFNSDSNRKEYPIYDSGGKMSDKVIALVLDNRYEDLEFAIRGVKKIWVPKKGEDGGEFKYVKKDRHCYSEEVIENILSKLQGWLSIDIKMANFNRNSFHLFMAGGIYKGEEVDGLLDIIVDYFEEITRIEVPKFKRFVDGVSKLYKNDDELTDEEVYMLMRESAEICNVVRVRVYSVFSRAVGGEENKSTHGNMKINSEDSIFGNDFMKDLDKF
jgi:hypothetical protein